MRGPLVLAATLVGLTWLFATGAAHFEVPAFVENITTPVFSVVRLPPATESVEAMEAHLHRVSGHEWFRQLSPNQGGSLWIAIIVLAVAGLDQRGWNARTRDLILIQLVAWLLFGTLDLFEQTNDPRFLGWIRLLFEAVALVTAVVWARTFWLQWRPYREPWLPAAGRTTLAVMATVLMVMNIFVVFADSPDDSSVFANLGGQRLRERGRLPYGDPMLTGTAGAAYGPLMYVLHAGAQAAIGVPMHDPVEAQPKLGPTSNYVEPPRVATQIVLAFSHLVGLAALWVLGRRALGETGAWALVALYAGASYLLAVGGSRESTSGLSFASHIVPASATLVAFAVLHRPAISGALLAVSAGLGFYPAFFFPIWATWQWRQAPRAALRFTAGFALVCAVIGAGVFALSQPAPGMGLVATIVRDTLGHHSGPNGYGLSIYGLWGQQTGRLGWLGHPLVGTASWSSPFFALFVASLLLASARALRADLARLSLLTAGAAIGANLWKIHATATYVSWYYPFLLLGLLALSHDGHEPPTTGTASR